MKLTLLYPQRKPEVDKNIKEKMDATDGKWTKAGKGQFKNLLKEYKRQMRSINNHTGEGEKPEVLWATEMNLIVSLSNPAIIHQE